MSDGRAKRSLNLATAAARAGADTDPGNAPPLVPAIDQTTVHSYRSLADLDRVFDREAAGHVYYAYAQDSVPPLPASLKEAIRVFADSPFTRVNHPETGRRIDERGAEFFCIRDDGKVHKHTMFEHTWTEGENAADPWPAL